MQQVFPLKIQCLLGNVLDCEQTYLTMNESVRCFPMYRLLANGKKAPRSWEERHKRTSLGKMRAESRRIHEDREIDLLFFKFIYIYIYIFFFLLFFLTPLLECNCFTLLC